MLKMLISFSHSDFLPFFSWCFTVAKEMEFSGFGLELAVKLLKSLQSSSWNEWLLVIARSCSFINYLGFYHDPAQLIVLTNGVPSVSVLWLHCGRSLLISNAAGQWKWKKLVSGWYLPRPWWCRMHCSPNRWNLLLWFFDWFCSMLAFPSHWMFGSFPSRVLSLLNYC